MGQGQGALPRSAGKCIRDLFNRPGAHRFSDPCRNDDTYLVAALVDQGPGLVGVYHLSVQRRDQRHAIEGRQLFADERAESLPILIDEEDVHVGRARCFQDIFLDQRNHHHQHGGHDKKNEQPEPVAVEQAQFLKKGGKERLHAQSRRSFPVNRRKSWPRSLQSGCACVSSPGLPCAMVRPSSITAMREQIFSASSI